MAKFNKQFRIYFRLFNVTYLVEFGVILSHFASAAKSTKSIYAKYLIHKRLLNKYPKLLLFHRLKLSD